MNPIKRITGERPMPIVWNETCDIVYVNENIIFHSDTDAPYYTYDQYKYNSREFSARQFESLRADLDYISMMAEVDL